MAGNTRRNVGLLMGLIIVAADVYWTYTSYFDTVWLALGIIILVASIIWMYSDL